MAMKKTILLLFLLNSAFSYAQSRKIVKLTAHKIDVSLSNDKHFYNKIINPKIDTIQIVRILDLENRTVELITNHFDENDNLTKQVAENFDESGKTLIRNIYDAGSKSNQYSFFRNDSLLVQFNTFPKSSAGIKYVKGKEFMVERNEFQPYFNHEKLSIAELAKVTMIMPRINPQGESNNKAILAFLIDETGGVEDFKLLNNKGNNFVLKKNALEILQKYDYAFEPAIDLDGKPIKKWLYVTLNQKVISNKDTFYGMN